MYTKIKTSFLIVLSVLMLSACGEQTEKKETEEITEKEPVVSAKASEVLVEGDVAKTVDNALAFAAETYAVNMTKFSPDSGFPRRYENGETIYVKGGNWVSGFYPATLWYIYSYTNDTAYKTKALEYMDRLEKQKFNTNTHDLGFMMFCPYGNAMRFDTANFDKYDHIVLQSTESLCSRYNKNVGCIRSWDHGDWSYPVIIDNMMNLEMIWWSYQHHGDEKYNTIATKHAMTTMQKHFRPDFSSYHVVDYNPHSGIVEDRGTHQGYSDSSAWARGQGWGLYGYTMAYRMTKEPRYLLQAQKIAHFILDHENYPKDGVPYWDFNDPAIPKTERDASAAAVMAHAFLELSVYDESHRDYFKAAAEKILMSLSSDEYLHGGEENGFWLLKHSVGHKPGDSEIDVPLNYADYYYVESLLKYKELYMSEDQL